jgi:hypothetical protein
MAIIMAINEFAPDERSKLSWLMWWWFLLLGTLFWSIIAVTFASYFQNNLIIDEIPFFSWFLFRYV